MNCQNCQCPLPEALEQCPHCAWPGAYPNVRNANQSEQIDALNRRHGEALAEALVQGKSKVAEDFETAVNSSRAVFSRPIHEALRLAESDNQGYAPYYSLLHAGIRLPDKDRWDRLRYIADFELFGSYRDKVRFAALSLDGWGLPHYGDVCFELSETMISHRTTLFHENSAVFFEKERSLGHEPPQWLGFQASWTDRGKLALSKHVKDLNINQTLEQFPKVLLRPGCEPSQDIYVEAHIFGSLTRRSMARVRVCSSTVSPALVQHLCDLFGQVGIGVEES